MPFGPAGVTPFERELKYNTTNVHPLSGGPPITTGIDASTGANIPPPSSATNPAPSLSDQIAQILANSAANQVSGGVRPVPVMVPSQSSNAWVWIVIIGAAIGAWYLLRKKREHASG